jgi:outer membrane immunogenic protein
VLLRRYRLTQERVQSSIGFKPEDNHWLASSRKIEMKKLLGSLVAGLFVAGSAFAADTPVKALLYKAPPPPPALSWTGYYGGVNAGYNWDPNGVDTAGAAGQCNATAAGCRTFPNLYSIVSAQTATFNAPMRQNGFIGGGQIGHNWQVSPAGVVGVEADIQGIANSNKSLTLTSATPVAQFPGFPLNQVATVTSRLDYLGTVRGRVGLLATPSFLAYATTGGFAYGGVSASTSINQNLVSGGLGPYGGAGAVSTTRAGWTAGAGLEWMCASNWSVKAEYLYVDLGTVNYGVSPLVSILSPAGTTFSSATATSSLRVTENIVRAG